MTEAVGGKEQGDCNYRSRSFYFKKMQSKNDRHVKSLSMESASKLCPSNSFVQGEGEDHDRQHDASSKKKQQQRQQINGWNLNRTDNRVLKLPFSKDLVVAKHKPNADMEQMKERFAKLLLGEDMSGGGKGVSSALALSNAITNLAASVFGEQRRLEPMTPERKARWRKEIDWLLSTTDYIVELVPSQQQSDDGSSMEIMVTRQRSDLLMNIPALRKLDAMLIDCLNHFRDQSEFYYVSKDSEESEKGGAQRKDEKWWLPTVKVPTNGLSEASRKFLQYQKDCVNQVLKAALAINALVLSEMEIPENYIDSLPKNGRESLGESIYRSITDDFFDPDQFLSGMDLSSEHKILEFNDKIEASMVIWQRKKTQKDQVKSSWGSAVSLTSSVSLERRELFEERTETILTILKHRFPGIPQSALDISKIQYNRDVGQAVLESYSRVLESLAFTVLSQIDDVLNADRAAHIPLKVQSKRILLRESTSVVRRERLPDETEDGFLEDLSPSIEDSWNQKTKLPDIVTSKKVLYLDSLSGLSSSPTSCH